MKILSHLSWLLLAILCAWAAHRTFEGWAAWLWVPGAFALPWIVRGEVEKRFSDRLPMLLCLVFLLLALFTGCSTPGTLDVAAIKAQQEARYSTRTIEIQTLPPGAIIDLNNNVVGVSPCTITLERCWDGTWPANSYNVQLLRARWTDGSYEEQKFLSTAPVPGRVVFLHPIPSHIAPPPATLTQR